MRRAKPGRGREAYERIDARGLQSAAPYALCLGYRLRFVLDLLGDYDDLTTLAFDLGFSSHSHFSAAFKQAYGQTPLGFQRSARIR